MKENENQWASAKSSLTLRAFLFWKLAQPALEIVNGLAKGNICLCPCNTRDLMSRPKLAGAACFIYLLSKLKIILHFKEKLRI